MFGYFGAGSSSRDCKELLERTGSALFHRSQPIATEDGTIWVVCNGEIHNFKELRNELEKKRHPGIGLRAKRIWELSPMRVIIQFIQAAPRHV
jgi:asparagine synthetase B (glutamine-hydrolysing)